MSTRTKIATPGRRFIESEAYQRALDGGYFRSGHPLPESAPIELLDGPELRGTMRLRTYTDLTDFDIEGVPFVGELPGVAHLPQVVETIPVENVMVELASETSESLLAQARDDGEPLPEGQLSTSAATPTLQKLPRVGMAQPVTLDVLDEPGRVESFINRRMSLGINLGLENDMLNGNAWWNSFPSQASLTPIVRSGGVYRANTLARAVGAVQTAGWYERPLQIVIHPTTYALMFEEEDGSQRPLGTDVQGMFKDTVDTWVITNKIPVDEALVGDFFNGIALFTKGPLTAEMSRQHKDLLTRSMVLLKFEFRAFAWVREPNALVQVTGLT